VIGPGYTYGSVTDKISSIVLTRPTSLGWYIGFLIALQPVGHDDGRHRLADHQRHRHWRINVPIGWDLRSLISSVDRIGHAGTLISAILFLLINQKVAHLYQPLRRGDDAFRR